MPGTDGLLAFVRNGDIYAATAAGQNAHRLTAYGGGAANPKWSSDGTRIAFERAGAIWTMTANGGSVVKRANGHAASWSPDDQFLAYETTTVACPHGAVLTKNLRTGATRQLVCAFQSPVLSLGRTTSWSPDGQRIIYNQAIPAPSGCQWCLDETDLNEVTVATKAVRSLPIQQPTLYCDTWAEKTLDPDYAPLRDNYVFTSDIPDCKTTAVWVFNRAGTYRKKLSRADVGVAYPVFSPDNKYVYYTASAGSTTVVRRVTLTATPPPPITVLQNATQPDVQPL